MYKNFFKFFLTISQFYLIFSASIENKFENCPSKDHRDIGTLLGDACVIFEETKQDGGSFHSIFCRHFDYATLKQGFQEYNKKSCKLPIKLYLTKVSFQLDRELFSDISNDLATLIIKNWNPFPVDDRQEFANPFVDMKNLKILDIAFDRHSKFSVIPKKFLEGLESVEAVLFEGIPKDVVIENGMFDNSLNTGNLQCIGLIDFTVPCSCDTNDAGHWLHRWLRLNRNLWGDAQHGPLAYTDKVTSGVNYFLCEVKLTCHLKEINNNGQTEDKYSTFHDFHWNKRCHLTTATTTSTVEPSTKNVTFMRNDSHRDDMFDVHIPQVAFVRSSSDAFHVQITILAINLLIWKYLCG